MIALILGLAAGCSPPPIVGQHAGRDPCSTTFVDGVYRLADDAKGRRYLAMIDEVGRPVIDGGTFRLDTSDAHVVAPFNAHYIAPFNGLSTIVRARLNRPVLATSLVSVHADGRDVTCPLRTTTLYETMALYPRDIASYTRTFDATPVADPPLLCNHPFVDGGAYRRIAVEPPTMPRRRGTSNPVIVGVIVDQDGRPTITRVAAGSLSQALDHAALAAAKAMRYQRPIYRCASSPQGEAHFRVDFTPRIH